MYDTFKCKGRSICISHEFIRYGKSCTIKILYQQNRIYRFNIKIRIIQIEIVELVHSKAMVRYDYYSCIIVQPVFAQIIEPFA